MDKKSFKGWLYLLPAILFLGFFMVYPLIDVFIYSFEEGYNSASQTFFGTGFYNYQYILRDPYFLQALKNTSMSGVDVRLMIPEHSDSVIADYASMSYIDSLLSSGGKVYLYREGMLHCKTVVCDDYLSSIGSTNLDFRSFFYNFEISAFVYDKAVAMDVKESFLNDLKLCRQLTANEYRRRSFSRRALSKSSRVGTSSSRAGSSTKYVSIGCLSTLKVRKVNVKARPTTKMSTAMIEAVELYIHSPKLVCCSKLRSTTLRRGGRRICFVAKSLC